MDTTWSAGPNPSLKARSLSRSVSPTSMHFGADKKSQKPCRFYAPGKCAAGSRCAFRHGSPADEESDDYPDMTHITSSMDQLAFLDDDFVSKATASVFAPASKTSAFDFTSESLFSSSSKPRRSLLPSFLLDECGSEPEDLLPESKQPITEELQDPVVFLERPASAAPRMTSTPTPSPSPVSTTRTGGISYGDAIRIGKPEKTATNAPQGYSLTPSAVVESEPNFDDFEEADAYVPVPTSRSTSDELCAFSILGKCRYGHYCRNLHGLQCPRCLLYILHPTDMQRNEEHLFECLSKPESTTFSDLHQIKCGICNEPVLQKVDPRFGLLNCNHAFCLSCIRTWRAANFDANDEGSRSCPDCYEVTYFIVPSSTWIEDPVEKEKVIDQYKKKMSVIPCKYHDNGRGSCPFGSSCFYEHRNDYAPGEDSYSSLDPARAAYRQALNDQNERLAKVREAKLSDYIVFKSVPSLGKKNKNKD